MILKKIVTGYTSTGISEVNKRITNQLVREMSQGKTTQITKRSMRIVQRVERVKRQV